MTWGSVALSGANGFLGFHVRAALRERGLDARPIALGDAYDVETAGGIVDGADRLVHLAGINRGTDDEVRDGNILLARQMAEALVRSSRPPATVVFANSTQSANGSIYGGAKAKAADILHDAAASVGATFQDVRLPNLFGEHGRPFYNAVTATFCHMLARGDQPTVQVDRELTLLHAQDAADILIGARSPRETEDIEARETVGGLLTRLTGMADLYSRGEIPDISTEFNRNLFNTYRSHAFSTRASIKLARHADARGSFFEIIRSHGGSGQSSFSTTEAGVSRGDHFHRRKIERFTVLSGSGTITLRRLFGMEIISFPVTGGAPTAVDMPTMWAHKITNTGSEPLYTSFWSNDIFDPEAPDTIAETV